MEHIRCGLDREVFSCPWINLPWLTLLWGEKKHILKKNEPQPLFLFNFIQVVFLWLFIDSEVMFSLRLWSCWHRWQRKSSQIPEDRLWCWECMLCWFCIQSSVTDEGRKEVCSEIHEEVDPLYPHAQTHIPAHHQTRSQETSRVFWTASHPQHLLKRIFGDKQTNRATLSYIETCIFLTIRL